MNCTIEESVEGERNRSSTLRLSGVTRSVAGDYVCSASNVVGETTATAGLTVYCKCYSFTSSNENMSFKLSMSFV